MKNTLLKIGGLAVAIGGAYLYMKNKGKKEQAQALASMEVAQATTQPAVTTTTDTGTYTKDEAKKLAMSVVDKVILQLDQIPKDRLADKTLSAIRQEKFDADQKEYKKAKALAVKDKKEQFTFLGKTYTSGVTNKGLISTTVKGGQLVVDGKPNPSFSEFEPSNWSRGEIMMSTSSFFSARTLGDFVKNFKKTEWLQLYDNLVNVFTKMPKSEVDSILPILPKYTLLSNKNFAYFTEMNEKNPLTMQETLLLREANLEQYTPQRDSILGTQIKAFQTLNVNTGIK
jgi:hypothetical protein